MTSVLECPSCRKDVSVAGELIGRIVACPHCAGHFSVPAEGADPVPVTATAPGQTAPPPLRFTFSCQRCGSILEALADLCGQPGACPTCGATFTIPQVDRLTGLATGAAEVIDDGQLPTPVHAYATAGAKAPQIRRLESGKQVIICPRCRREMPIDAESCSACGIPFTIEGVASVGQVGRPGNGLAVAGLTIGILAVLSSPCPPVLGVVAIGLGFVGLRRAANNRSDDNSRKLAIAGIICGFASGGLFALFHYLL